MSLQDAKNRAEEAKKFPVNTCAASRHLYVMADFLSRKKSDLPIEEVWDRDQMAESIYAVLADLWELRGKK